MSAKILPPTEKLNHSFSYDPETGVLTWKNPHKFAPLKAGDRAGGLSNNGYIHVNLAGKIYQAHRLIYKMAYGVDPSDQLDHISRDRTDNRLANLREATHSENMRNTSRCTNNTSGTTGVHRTKDGRKNPWRVQIHNNESKRINKHFATEAEAIAQRRAWEIEFNYICE